MKNKIPLQARILEQIERENIIPTPSWQYKTIRYILWGMVIGFIIVSSIFAAFLLQDSLDIYHFRSYAPSSIFHPGIIWFVLVVFLGYLGILVFRRTATGYRYSTARDMLVWILIIIFLIPILKLSGVGPFLHSEFFDTFPEASNFVYQASSWNNPVGGRIAGTITAIKGNTITIRALDATTSDIDFGEVKIGSSVKLQIGKRVRVIGSLKSDGKFIADRILPWFGEGGGNGGFRDY
ncbi:MAG: hypothetical protein PHU93_03440 [Candidatus Gracilibacteria bacterium]|nr:hypothetical protein [Candidatus Gracilibacteria bacterium]